MGEEQIIDRLCATHPNPERCLELIQAASNPFLLSALQSLRGTAMRLMCLSYRQPGAMASLWAEHHRILEALSGRDPGAAEQAGQEHIEAGKRRMFEHVSSAPFR